MIHSRLGLIARNEGKIKSYESCSDLRAWSHDLQKKNQYLREWIKSDMRICIIPSSTLASFLRTMTIKGQGKVISRCHPNCKSKVVLESICSSCHAVKECLKQDKSFEKYFEEEELETCHWPCERCLDALKSIKMFWKVIVDKVFCIRVPKTEEHLKDLSVCSNSVRNTAKAWQAEMVQQAWCVKNFTHLSERGITGRCQCKRPGSASVRESSHVCKPDELSSIISKKSPSTRSNMTNLLETNQTSLSKANKHRQRKVVSRFVSVKVKTVDVGCETCDLQKENEESGAFNCNLNYLQHSCNEAKTEIERLKKENTSLKFELQNYYNGYSLKSHLCSLASMRPTSEAMCPVPKPFDFIEDNLNRNSVKNIDSEMIITMKNCRNSNYKNVSLFQVLHKSNEPFSSNPSNTACRQEDPVDLLSKMHNVFGSIIRREISTAKDKGTKGIKLSEIDASYHRVIVSRSAPSCNSFGDKSETVA